MGKVLLLVIIICAVGCMVTDEKDPQAVIDKTLEVSGIENLEQAELTFVFRNMKYEAKFKNGRYQYTRQFQNNAKSYRDVMNNEGFYREVNGDIVSVIDSMAVKYMNSINSVIYFALLPRGLNDQAVKKAYLGSGNIKGKDYHEVKVTFDQDGGGEDYQDEYIYWVNKENYKIDYLAYSFHTEGGGMRFREAFNERYVDGVRFVDYINYKPGNKTLLKDIDDAFINDQLEEISIIALEHVTVETF